MKYDKLLRDTIPEIIERKGGKAVFHIASPQEYQQKLTEKLSEEVGEYLESKSPEELADILEVLYALGELQSVSSAELELLRKEKAIKRGGFSKQIILDESF